MNVGQTLFAQVMEFLPWKTFHRIVARYHGNQRVRRLSCAEQFRVMAFAQLTYRESLRDIEACLGAQTHKLYHMGIRQPVARSTLADANEARHWRIYADFAQTLIARARTLYAAERMSVELSDTVYALDSTTIDLSLSLFPWARYQGVHSPRAGVKVHTLLDLRGAIPSFLYVTKVSVHDVNVLDVLLLEPGAFYVMDRAYVDFTRLYTLQQAGCFFVTRAKRGMDYHRLYSAPTDRATGVLCDQTIALDGFYSQRHYPTHLRRIRYRDATTGKRLVFLTNHSGLPAAVICALYKSRWQVELFFKWVKQHLRIKRFYGTSENAVKSQLWIAVSVYVLVAIIKKQLHLKASLYTLLQILSVTLFEKLPIGEALADARYRFDPPMLSNQLDLFEN